MILLLTALFACQDDTVADVSSCDILLEQAEPASAEPGETVAVSGSPMTVTWDTALFLGGQRIEVSSVDRLDCDPCDTCREEAACNACEDCDTCDIECRVDCKESLSFVVPELAAGVQHIVVYNAHGSSNVLDFTVLAAPDTGEAGDSGDSGDSASPDE